jgi:hypothetical protein
VVLDFVPVVLGFWFRKLGGEISKRVFGSASWAVKFQKTYRFFKKIKNISCSPDSLEVYPCCPLQGGRHLVCPLLGR